MVGQRRGVVVVPPAARQLPAVDDQRLPVDERRVVRGEEEHGGGLLLDPPGTPHRNAARVRALARDVVGVHLRDRLGRQRLSGSDAVDAQAEVPELVRERARQRHDGGLRRVVGRLGRLALEDVGRGDRHDRAAAVRAHVAGGRLRREERALDVDRERALEERLVDLEDRALGHHARVVDEHVQAPERLDRVLDQRRRQSATSAMSPARVCRRGLASSAAVCARRRSSTSAASTVAPSREEGRDDRAADAARRSGDEDVAPVEPVAHGTTG